VVPHGQTVTVVGQHKIDQWAALLAESELIVHEDPPGGTPDALDTALPRHSLGVFAALERVERGPGTAMEPAHTIAMMVIESGPAVATYDRRSFPVAPGDVVIWDGGVPLALDAAGPVRRRVLLFPRASAIQMCPRYETLLGRAIPGHGALIGTLFEVVDLLRPRLGAMGATVREAAANLMVQLFAGLDPDADRLASRPGTERLLAAVLGHIDAHLGEADLTPARIAAAHSISVRTLYSLFTEVGTPVSAYVRQRRLSRGYHNVVHGGESIGAIARRWGFANAAQFSRLFREQYGVPPSHLRAAQHPA
jgi:AraC-like DNA-binding protein